MPRIKDWVEIPRRVLTVFFVLDVSGVMSGSRIAVLNHAMTAAVAALKELDRRSVDVQIKIAVLTYSSGCTWLNPDGPESPEDFVWEDLQAGGMSDLGAALRELNDKLSRKAYMNNIEGNCMPVFVFVTCRGATDNYEAELRKLQKNNWFRHAAKIGFAMGDESNIDTAILCDAAEYNGAVFRCPDSISDAFPDALKSSVALLPMILLVDRVWSEEDGGWPQKLKKSGVIPKEMFLSGEYILKPPPDLDDDLWENADDL